MQILIALIAGLVFGIGLIVSGMANPAKVMGFLDLTGKWDPSLAFVMGGAVGVGLLVFQWSGRQAKTLLGEAMQMPTARHIDRRLVIGSLAFGVGWGLAGFCPGPALTALAMGEGKPFIFVAAMVTGMLVFEILERGGRAKAKEV